MNLNNFLESGNLFTEIDSVNQFPFITGNEDTLQAMLILQHGDSILYEAFNGVELKLVAEMLVLEYGDKWDSYIKRKALFEQLHNEVETTDSKTRTENRTGARNDLNKVSGYNSDDLMVNDGSDSTNAEDSEAIETGTRIVIDRNIGKAYFLLDDSEKRLIIKSVLKDVSDLLTLNIY